MPPAQASAPSWEDARTTNAHTATDASAHTGFDWLSLARGAIQPFTSYPETYSQMNREAREQVAHGVEQLKHVYQPEVHDPIEFMKGLGNVGLGSLGYFSTPISAGLRTIAGKPIEDATGVPKEYTEFLLSLLPFLRASRSSAGPAVTVPREVRPFVAPEQEPVVTFGQAGLRASASASKEAAPEIGSSVRTAPAAQGRLFDDTHLHEVPQVEQRNLPRYEPEHGAPDHILALDNPETLGRLDEFARIGLERGGHKAFNIEPLRQHFITQLGLEKGQAAFKQLTDFMGAVSPVSTDLATLRNASYYDWLAKQGLPLPNPIWDAAKGGLVLPKPLPPPYGHFKQGLHAQKVNEVVQQGGLDAIENPKLGSIAENFSGNLNPIGIDRHIVRALGATDSRGRPIDRLPRSGYDFVERLLQEQAAKMGLSPAQYQGAIRAGAGKLTGLRSFDPMLVTLQKRIAITAERDGISEAEVLKRFIGQGYPLASIGALAGAEAVPRQGNGPQAGDE
jgi:hypothetical protein